MKTSDMKERTRECVCQDGQQRRTKKGEVDEGKVIEKQEPEEFACIKHTHHTQTPLYTCCSKADIRLPCQLSLQAMLPLV